jgi:hypothetical protein
VPKLKKKKRLLIKERARSRKITKKRGRRGTERERKVGRSEFTEKERGRQKATQLNLSFLHKSMFEERFYAHGKSTRMIGNHGLLHSPSLSVPPSTCIYISLR